MSILATPEETECRKALSWAEGLFEMCDHRTWLSTYHLYSQREHKHHSWLVRQVGVLPERGFGLWDAAQLMAGMSKSEWIGRDSVRHWEGMATVAAYLESNGVHARVGFGGPRWLMINRIVLLSAEQTATRAECERIVDLVLAIPEWVERSPRTVSDDAHVQRGIYR